jgi:hypothetical protein
MKYFEDENFITKVGDGKVTTIAKATGQRATLKIGDSTFSGTVLDQEWYDELLAKCDKEM